MKLRFSLPALLIVCALVAGCLSKEQNNSSTYYAVCSFEYANMDNYWADSLYFEDDFVGADGLTISHWNPSDPMFPRENGFLFSARHDPTLAEGHQAKPLAVLGKSDPATLGEGYVIYVDKAGEAARHTITFDYQPYGTATLTGFYVNNTNQVATIASFGLDGIPAFISGDWLKLTVTGYTGSTKGATQEVMLADYTGSELKLIKEWTAVSTSDFGTFQYLDFSITSNRADIPLQACIDNLTAYVQIEY